MENRVLIIDDEVEILKLLETVLKKEGLNNI
ncbi:TPA: DNA-binding response regulator, partial [Clostridioides difficile]|nr:DNA-binding response regulator [Clostridioides difficile]